MSRETLTVHSLIDLERFNKDEVNDSNISRDVSEMVVVKMPWEMKETDCKVNYAVEPRVSWFSLITLLIRTVTFFDCAEFL